MQTITTELTEEVPLCDARGRLNPAARGWSRHPLHVCNLHGRFPRKKRWDYWCVLGEPGAFSVTAANIDYVAGGAVFFLEYQSGLSATRTVFPLLARTPRMPERTTGAIAFDHQGLRVRFDAAQDHVHLEAECRDAGGKELSAVFDIQRPADLETLNVVVPWSDRTFQFTSKQVCLPAEGRVRWGDREYVFAGGSSYGVLDFGRGIWPYRTVWNWGALCGRSGEDTVGVTLGGQWTDGTGMNENGIVLNGRLHKVFDDVVFEFDHEDVMQPWRVRTVDSDVVDLTLTPSFDNASHTNLGLVRSDAHQMFGRYSGVLKVDGRRIAIADLPGWAEEHDARW